VSSHSSSRAFQGMQGSAFMVWGVVDFTFTFHRKAIGMIGARVR